MHHPVNPRAAWLLAAATWLALPAHSVEPFSFDTAAGRLPKDVVPLLYRLQLTPDVATMSIDGSEQVQLQVRSATATLRFNSLHQTLADVRFDGRPVAQVESSDADQTTTVTLAAPARPGRHTLSFRFHGRIEKQPIGLFAQDYVDADGRTHVLLSSHMESVNARRMFPCWDEPAFRARFDLTMTIPAEWSAIANMPEVSRRKNSSTVTVRYAPTPRMPSYLVEFTAGELAAIEGRSGRTLLGVWAVRGQQETGRTALDNAALILADYNDYFGVPFPLPKLDSIATPGGFSGAMENWGAITYTQRSLLLGPSSTEADRQGVFSIQAHEMAHQWNGDLVTMGWWDDIWLNESFATFMAARETDLRNPDWHWRLSRDANREVALRADARGSALAIQQHVSDEQQVQAAFDSAITYNKGEALLRMFERYLGAEVFRDGVRRLMRSHAYSNATTADLWRALDAASGRDVHSIAADWTEQPGFPLLDAQSRCAADGARTVHVTQRRFLVAGTEAAGRPWHVPILWRSGTGDSHSLLLDGASAAFAAGRCDDPLSLNADAVGYYRVRYDAATLEATTRAFARLPEGDRVALLDDQWALAEAGLAPLGDYLTLVRALGNEPLPRAWQQIAGALESLDDALRAQPEQPEFQRFARSLLQPVVRRLGWEARDGETADVRRLRRTVLADVGRWGDPDVLREAQRRYARYRSDPATLPPDDAPLVLGLVAAEADAATFADLRSLLHAVRDPLESPRYLDALMQVRDPQLAEQAAKIAVSGEVPPQYGAQRLRYVTLIARQHPELAWRTFTAHTDTILAPRAPYGPLTAAQDMPEVFVGGVPLQEIEPWVRQYVPAALAPQIARGLEGARFRLESRTRLVPQVRALLRSAAAAPASGTGG